MSWEVAPLRDVIKVHHGFAFQGEFFRDGAPGDLLVTPGNFALGGGFQWHKAKYYDGPVDDRFVLKPGDLIITMTDLSKGSDTLGSPARVPDLAQARILHNQRIGRVEVTAPQRAVPEFLYWALRSHAYRRQVVASATGTTVKHTSPTRIGDALIPLPPVEEQQPIAEVLDTLDNKIDSNRRLAGVLEEAVAAVFRARFVDFVGVEEFEDSELGPIPRGWSAGSLADLARFVNGKAFTKHANGLGRPIVRIRELNSGVDDGTPRSDLVAADDFISRSDDILFAWSGSLGVHRWHGEEALINQHIFKVLPDSCPSWFVYAWIQQHMDTFRAIARDKATTMGHIQRRHLAEAAVPLPIDSALRAADQVLGPIDLQRAMLAKETITLASVRDALLPKLVSGAIRVPDSADPAEVIEPMVE